MLACVIQELSEGITVFGKKSPLVTMVVPFRKLKTFSRAKIVAEILANETPTHNLIVSPAVVEKWGLKEGDIVQLSDQNPDSIVAVNGENDPGISRFWPLISGIKEQDDSRELLHAAYPERLLPVDQFGDLSMKALTLLAPIGKGQSLYLAAPGGAGKTTVLLSLWEALLRLTHEDDKLYPIVLHLGERGEDFTDFMEVWGRYPPKNGETYSAPRSDPLHIQLQLFEFVIKRARRLTQMGYDVVLIIDSVTRAVMAHSRSSEIDANGGMIAGGLHTSSISFVSQLLGVAGDFGDRSLTIVSSVLAAAKGKKTSEAAFTDETMDSASTAAWVLGYYPMLPRPWIDVSTSRTRRFDRFTTPEHQEAMEALYGEMWKPGNNALAAHKVLLEHVQGNPS